MGNRAKTDRVNAELITRFVAQEHAKLCPYTSPTADQHRLVRQLAKIVRIKSSLKLTLVGLGLLCR